MPLHSFKGLYQRLIFHNSLDNKLFFAGLICVIAYSIMAFYSLAITGFPLLIFGSLVSLIFLVLLGVFVGDKCDNVLTIILFAFVFRIIAFYGAPIYEDDFYRYLWDGFRFAVDGTPYNLAPEAYFLDANIPQIFQRILDGINHPDIPTIYAPTFQYIFLAAYWIAPGELWSLKLLLIGFDCLLIVLLSRQVPARYLILYAWNPLVIKEIGFTAHPDGVLGGLLLISWILLKNKQRYGASVALAFAVATKVAAWPVAPFLLLRCRFLGLFCFLIILLILYYPFFVHQNSDLIGLVAFAQHFEFNSALYGLINLVLSGTWTKFLLGISYLLMLAYYGYSFYRQTSNTLPRVDIILGGLLLISPVINPWYLLWILPWACLVPSYTAWAASGFVLISYITGLNLINSDLGAYDHPLWLRPLEFGLIAVALMMDLFRTKQDKTIGRRYVE